MLSDMAGSVLPSLGLALAAAVAAPPEGRRIALSYDQRLVQADFPNPAVRLTVGEKSAWFLVDTGAGVHLIASWFVRAAGLPVDEAFGKQVSGVDATGRELPFRGIRGLKGVLGDGSSLVLPVAAVTDFSPDFEKAGVAGAINPQLLAAAGEAAALDLRAPELRFEPFESAVRRLGARVVPRKRLVVCGSTSGPVPNLLFALPVSVRGKEGSLVIDTGARVTKLAPDSGLVQGLRLEPGGETTGVAGVAQSFALTRGLEVRFAGHAVTLDARVAGRGHGVCGRDGLLGLDALSGCAVVLGARDLALACGR
jgi:hypothetical protein